MKKTILIIAFLTCVATVFGQSISEVDKKRGFKSFIIDDDISKYSRRLEYYTTLSSGEVGYRLIPVNENEITVFLNRFSNIYLYFKDDKLQNIILKKFYSGDSFDTALEEFKSLMGNLMELFGAPNEKIDQDPLMGYAWNGKKIMLICTNKYLGVSKGSETEIMISDYPKAIKSGF